MKILLLEDDQTYAKVLERQLTRHHFQVNHLNDCSQLIATATEWQPDCLILDMNLGTESSLPYISELRALLPTSKILLVTGFSSIATTVAAIKAGADDYIPKPIELAGLLRAIKGEQTSEECDVDYQRLSPERLEWEYIQRILLDNNGNVSQTARQLNMHRRTLQRKLSKKPVNA